MKLKELKKGDYFTIVNVEYPKESQVFIKGEYDRTLKTFTCSKFSDICSSRNFKSDKEVFVDFIF